MEEARSLENSDSRVTGNIQWSYRSRGEAAGMAVRGSRVAMLTKELKESRQHGGGKLSQGRNTCLYSFPDLVQPDQSAS